MKWKKVSCLLNLFSLTLVSHFPFLKGAWISVITNDQIVYKYNLESSLQILKVGTWLLLWIHVKRMLSKMQITVQEYFNTAFNVFFSDVLKTCTDIDIGLKKSLHYCVWNPYSSHLKAIPWFHANVFSVLQHCSALILSIDCVTRKYAGVSNGKHLAPHFCGFLFAVNI